MTDLSISGLASGLDTDTVIQKLLGAERRPQIRLKLQQHQAQVRRDALRDVNTRLSSLQRIARDLSHPALWADTQTAASTDSSRVTVKGHRNQPTRRVPNRGHPPSTRRATELQLHPTGRRHRTDHRTQHAHDRDRLRSEDVGGGHQLHGVDHTSPTEVVADAIPGLDLTLSGATSGSPVTHCTCLPQSLTLRRSRPKSADSSSSTTPPSNSSTAS
jgi:flagellar capping protein FliD